MSQPRWKQQYRERSNELTRWRSELSNFKFRIALPAADGKGSERFWKEANSNYVNQIHIRKSRIGENHSIRKEAKPLEIQMQKTASSKKFERYQDKFSFFTTIGGKNAKLSNEIPQNKAYSRPLTCKAVKRQPHLQEDNFLTESTPHSQIQKRILSAVDRNSWVERNLTELEQEHKWTGISRPLSGKQTVKICNSEEFHGHRERIDNLKNKITSETQYSSPIDRIGYNMQSKALFTYQHLELLSKSNNVSKAYFPIQYAIADMQIKTHHVYDLEKYDPVSVSLFSEFYDTNCEASRQTREEYLQGWLNKVGRNYDPVKVSSFYKSKQLNLEETNRYNAQLSKINVECISPFNSEWVQNALGLIQNILISQQQVVQWIKEIWSLYEHSMRKAILDYQLLNFFERKRLGISCVPTTLNMIERTTKEGGYSMKLFPEHAFFVNIARCRLDTQLWKYNQLSVSLQKWFYDFKDIRLVQTQISSVMVEQGCPVGLGQFIEMQEQHFVEVENVLDCVWMRGSMWIIFKEMFLQCSPKNPWRDIISKHSEDSRSYFRAYIRSHKHNDTTETLKELVERSRIHKVSDRRTKLISIHNMEPAEVDSKPITLTTKILLNLNQLLNLQLYQIIEDNVTSLLELLNGPMVFELEPVLTNTVELSMGLQEAETEVRTMFNRIMKMSYQSSGVTMSSDNKANSPYLSLFNTKTQPNDKIKVEWKSRQHFQYLIDCVVQRLSHSYKGILQQLQPLKNFIALTTSCLVLPTDHYSFQQFIADSIKLKSLRHQLNQIHSEYSSGMLVVNTSALKKQIDCKIQVQIDGCTKVAKKGLTTRILELEQEITDKEARLFRTNTTPMDICENEKLIEEYQHKWIPRTSKRSRQLMKECVDFIVAINLSDKNKTAVLFHSKVAHLFKCVISFPTNLKLAISKNEEERSGMESSLKTTKVRLFGEISSKRLEFVGKMESFGYIPSKFKDYNNYTQQFKVQIEALKEKTLQYSTNCGIIFGEWEINIDDLNVQLQECDTLDNVYGFYWNLIHNLHHQLKTLMKTELSLLECKDVERLISNYQKGFEQVVCLFDSKDPYLKYINTLKEEMAPIERYLSLLKMLTQKELTQESYAKYDPKIAGYPLKKILEEWNEYPPKEKDFKLIERICEVAKMEATLSQVVQRVKEQVNKEIEVVESDKCCGSMSIDISADSLELMQSHSYLIPEIEANRHVSTKLKELRDNLNTYKAIVTEIIRVNTLHTQHQTIYVQLSRLYHSRYKPLMTFGEKFKKLESISREIIKIAKNKQALELSTNKYLVTQISRARDLSAEIKHGLQGELVGVLRECPRMNLLLKDEFYQFITRQISVETMILKCFPNVGGVTIKDRTITAVGRNTKMVLNHPVIIEYLYPEIWILQLEEEIKDTINSTIAHSLQEQPNQQLPQQVQYLILMLQYTQKIDECGESSQELERLLEALEASATRSAKQIHMFIRRMIQRLVLGNLAWKDLPKVYFDSKLVVRVDNRVKDYGYNYHDTSTFEWMDTDNTAELQAILFGIPLVKIEDRSLDHLEALATLQPSLNLILSYDVEDKEISSRAKSLVQKWPRKDNFPKLVQILGV